MGSKGSTTTTNQQQSYAPNAPGYTYGALDKAGAAAALPFNIPQAPVAGFSPDQQNAFNTVNGAQGMALPYFNQANNYFNQSTQAPDISQFFNPYAGAVTDNLKDIFGQQQSQTTGQLTQAAGGVGADRIAVGQANLAKQQGLAAGQTLSALYQPSLQAAQNEQNIKQSAGYGIANLGGAAQNSVLSGAQAQLGTGGLQQQLAQAQLNSPYQQQLAQAAFPYQQAQYYAGIVGALQPGLGGTTTGQGQTTAPGPSIFSQLLGGAGTAAGIAGATGGFGNNGWLTNAFGSNPSYGGGNSNSGDAYGGSSANPLQGLSASDYGAGFARGGATHPYHYDEGGGVPTSPIDISAHSIIPTGEMPHIQPHIPQLNLSPPQQQQSASGGSGVGDIAKIAQMAMMFANRGGVVHPYAGGGSVDNSIDVAGEEFPGGLMDVMRNLRAVQDRKEVESGKRFYDTGMRIPGQQKGRNDAYEESLKRRKFAEGGDTDVINPDEPYRLAGPEAMDAWRKESVPAAAFAGTDDAAPAFPMPKKRMSASAAPPASEAASSPYAPAASGDAASVASTDSLSKNPWMALIAAGLGTMAGTSPFAGVNIGQGGLQGLKALESQRTDAQRDTTIAQAAKRLEQEAKFHEDSFTRESVGQKNQRVQAELPYTKMTVAQQEAADRARDQDDLAERRFDRPYNELTKMEQAQIEQQKRAADLARIPVGMKRDENGNFVAEPGGPHDPETIRREAEAKRPPGMNEEALEPLVVSYMAGNAGVLAGVGRGTQGSANLEKFWSMMAQKLAAQGKTGADLAAARANFMGQSAGLRVAAQREANIETAVNEAKGTFPQVLKTSQALPRTDFPLVNTAIQAYRTNTGSEAQRQYGAAIQAAVTAYSQAMARTGTNSVYAQSHAESLLNKVDGHAALKATIEQLDAEMAIAQHAPEQTRQSIVNRILGVEEKPGAANAAGAAGAKTVVRQGTVNAGPNAGKTVIEYSDGTRDYR